MDKHDVLLIEHVKLATASGLRILLCIDLVRACLHSDHCATTSQCGQPMVKNRSHKSSRRVQTTRTRDTAVT
jgi:hypothetical protein